MIEIQLWQLGLFTAIIGTLVTWIYNSRRKQDADLIQRIIANETRIEANHENISAVKAACLQHNSNVLTETRLRVILKEELPIQFESFKNALYKEMYEQGTITPGPKGRRKSIGAKN
jgi:hypothetical protein